MNIATALALHYLLDSPRVLDGASMHTESTTLKMRAVLYFQAQQIQNLTQIVKSLASHSDKPFDFTALPVVDFDQKLPPELDDEAPAPGERVDDPELPLFPRLLCKSDRQFHEALCGATQAFADFRNSGVVLGPQKIREVMRAEAWLTLLNIVNQVNTGLINTNEAFNALWIMLADNGDARLLPGDQCLVQQYTLTE